MKDAKLREELIKSGIINGGISAAITGHEKRLAHLETALREDKARQERDLWAESQKAVQDKNLWEFARGINDKIEALLEYLKVEFITEHNVVKKKGAK